MQSKTHFCPNIPKKKDNLPCVEDIKTQSTNMDFMRENMEIIWFEIFLSFIWVVLLNPLTFQDLIVNSPLLLLHISLLIGYDNLVLDQDNNFCQLDKFGYSCYLFAGLYKDIVGRIYMLIISGS